MSSPKAEFSWFKLWLMRKIELSTVITFSRRHCQNMLSRSYSSKLQRFPVNSVYATSYKGFYPKKLLSGLLLPIEVAYWKKKFNIWLRILKDSQAAMSSSYSKRDMIWNRLSSRMTLTFETRHWIKILFLGGRRRNYSF